MRFSGRDAAVPDIRVTAFQNAEYVRAVASVTVSPDRDWDPIKFHSDGFQAFLSVRERLENPLLIICPACHVSKLNFCESFTFMFPFQLALIVGFLACVNIAVNLGDILTGFLLVCKAKNQKSCQKH